MPPPLSVFFLADFICLSLDLVLVLYCNSLIVISLDLIFSLSECSPDPSLYSFSSKLFYLSWMRYWNLSQLSLASLAARDLWKWENSDLAKALKFLSIFHSNGETPILSRITCAHVYLPAISSIEFEGTVDVNRWIYSSDVWVFLSPINSACPPLDGSKSPQSLSSLSLSPKEHHEHHRSNLHCLRCCRRLTVRETPSRIFLAVVVHLLHRAAVAGGCYRVRVQFTWACSSIESILSLSAVIFHWFTAFRRNLG